MSLPVGIFGSFFLLQAMGLANDVYCQIGLVMLVGLLGKNAILIVEFAVQRHHEGASLKDAAIEGGKLRFRPILMTSFAFIAGLIPLVRATGPGAIGNRTIGGTAVGGMLLGTVIGVLVIPGLYYLFGWLDGDRKLLQDETHRPLSESAELHGIVAPRSRTSRIRSTLLRQRSHSTLLLCRPVEPHLGNGIRAPVPSEFRARTREKSRRAPSASAVCSPIVPTENDIDRNSHDRRFERTAFGACMRAAWNACEPAGLRSFFATARAPGAGGIGPVKLTAVDTMRSGVIKPSGRAASPAGAHAR